MSFFSNKDRDECWDYFYRHIDQLPSKANKQDLTRFLMWKEEHAKLSTLGCYLGHIKAFGLYLGDTAWLDASKDDVFLHIKGAKSKQGRVPLRDHRHIRSLGKYTKYQRMVMLREFYKWLLDIDECPEQFRRLPFQKPSMEEQSEARDRVMQDELVLMLATTGDKRDRAILMFLADSGFRSGEASALDDVDVEFDDYGAKVALWIYPQDPTVPRKKRRGLKTGARKVKIRLTISVPYLKDWLDVHPLRKQGTPFPLFTSRSNRNRNDRLTSGGLWGVVDKLSRWAKIRHIHPHMLRHTAASIRTGDGWNEEMMRLHFGWSKGSAMPSLYSHSEADYEAFALRKAGFPVPKETETHWLVECEACGAMNEPDLVFCKCGVELP